MNEDKNIYINLEQTEKLMKPIHWLAFDTIVSRGISQEKDAKRAIVDDLIIKIEAVGILVAVLNLLLSRAGRDEQALMTTIAGLVVVLIIIIQEISDLFSLIKSLFGF